MATPLSDEQRQAIELRPGKPVEVVDPTSARVFYLISREQFDVLRSLLEPEAFDAPEAYAAQEQALRAIWDDPVLDVYNDPPDTRSAS